MLQKFALIISVTCRTLKDDVECTKEQLVFKLSSIGDTDDSHSIELSLEDVLELALQEQIIFLVDGYDELPFPRTRTEIERIRMKVRLASGHERMTGVEVIVGLLCIELVKHCKVFLAGRNNSIQTLYELLFTENVLESEINLGNGEVVSLPQEEVALAGNFEILPFSSDDLRTVSHNLFCQGAVHEAKEDVRCERASTIALSFAEKLPIIFVPSISRWTLEISDSRASLGITDGSGMENLTTIMIEYLIGRVREHARIDRDLVHDFSSLMMYPETEEFLKCLRAMTELCFKALLENQIIIQGKFIRIKGEQYIEAKGIRLDPKIVSKLDLLKVSPTKGNKLSIEAEHLSVMEMCCATELKKMTSSELEKTLLSLPTARQLYVTKLLAGLHFTKNDIVQDYVSVMAEGAESKEDPVLELCKIFARQPRDELPDTEDHVDAVINGVEVSGRFLGMTSLILAQVGGQRKLTFEEFDSLLQQVNQTQSDTVQSESRYVFGEVSKVVLTYTSSEYLAEVMSKDRDNDVKFVPSTWSSLLFLNSHLVDPTHLKSTRKMGWLTCSRPIPTHLDKDAVAGWMAQAKEVRLGDGCILDTSLCNAMHSAIKAADQRPEEFTLDGAVVEASGEALGKLLSLFQKVHLEETSMVSETWDQWADCLSSQSNELAMEPRQYIRLFDIDISKVESKSQAIVLSSYSQVELGGMNLTTGSMTEWTHCVRSNVQDRGYQYEQLTLDTMDLTNVHPKAVVALCATFKHVTIGSEYEYGGVELPTLEWEEGVFEGLSLSRDKPVDNTTIELKGIDNLDAATPQMVVSLFHLFNEVSLSAMHDGDILTLPHHIVDLWATQVQENVLAHTNDLRKITLRNVNVEPNPSPASTSTEEPTKLASLFSSVQQVDLSGGTTIPGEDWESCAKSIVDKYVAGEPVLRVFDTDEVNKKEKNKYKDCIEKIQKHLLAVEKESEKEEEVIEEEVVAVDRSNDNLVRVGQEVSYQNAGQSNTDSIVEISERLVIEEDVDPEETESKNKTKCCCW